MGIAFYREKEKRKFLIIISQKTFRMKHLFMNTRTKLRRNFRCY